jgi:L-glyceraldehyde 3-phosphate reductase
MGIEYADIFYHHRPDPETPLEETMGALDHIVKSGKALYVGISQYNAEDTKRASDILKSMGTKLLIHQPRYNMMDRWIENGLTDVLRNEGIGCIAFSPLVQGLLTNRYLDGIPSDSRAAKDGTYLSREQVTEDKINKIKKLNDLAATRNQSLAQMAIAWVLRDPVVTSALIGASKVSQVEDAVGAVKNINFSEEELKQIDDILS